MKTKRCTNSSCRRVFNAEYTVCPHCGKEYARIHGSSSKSGKRTVVLTSYSSSNKLVAVKVIRQLTQCDLWDAKKIAEHIPSVVGSGLTLEQANYWRQQFLNEGCKAKIVPAGTYKRAWKIVMTKYDVILGITPLFDPKYRAIVCTVQDLSGLDQRQAQMAVANGPSLIGSSLTYQEANLWKEKIRSVGGSAGIIPFENCKKQGIFVPEKSSQAVRGG